MSKEYRLQFNDKFISIEEQYQKDNGAILFGETNNDGRLYILYDSHDNKKIEFFIELIKYVADLKVKLTENIVLLEGLRKSEEEKKDMAMKRVYELKQQLKEKEKERELDNTFWKQECDSLQKALAEKDKIIENLKIDLKDWQELEEKLGTKYDKVVEQLAEKEKEIEMLQEHKFYADNIIQAYADKCKKQDQAKTEKARKLVESYDILDNKEISKEERIELIKKYIELDKE